MMFLLSSYVVKQLHFSLVQAEKMLQAAATMGYG